MSLNDGNRDANRTRPAPRVSTGPYTRHLMAGVKCVGLMRGAENDEGEAPMLPCCGKLQPYFGRDTNGERAVVGVECDRCGERGPLYMEFEDYDAMKAWWRSRTGNAMPGSSWNIPFRMRPRGMITPYASEPTWRKMLLDQFWLRVPATPVAVDESTAGEMPDATPAVEE